MSWFNILKMPVRPHPSPEKHELPIAGSYIKYCTNLLTTGHKFSFKKWWSWGFIRPPGSKSEPEHQEDLPEDDPKRNMSLHEWKKLQGASSHLGSQGLNHMKDYYKRRKDDYDKSEMDTAAKANQLFLALIQNLEQIVKEHKEWEKGERQGGEDKKYPAKDPSQLARHYLIDTLKNMEKSFPNRVLWKETQHGFTISLKPNWMDSVRGDWIQTRVNLSHTFFNMCFRSMSRNDETIDWDEEKEMGYDGRIQIEICTGEPTPNPEDPHQPQQTPTMDWTADVLFLIMTSPNADFLQGWHYQARGVSERDKRKEWNLRELGVTESTEITLKLYQKGLTNIKQTHQQLLQLRGKEPEESMYNPEEEAGEMEVSRTRSAHENVDYITFFKEYIINMKNIREDFFTKEVWSMSSDKQSVDFIFSIVDRINELTTKEPYLEASQEMIDALKPKTGHFEWERTLQASNEREQQIARTRTTNAVNLIDAVAAGIANLERVTPWITGYISRHFYSPRKPRDKRIKKKLQIAKSQTYMGLDKLSKHFVQLKSQLSDLSDVEGTHYEFR